jgi:hypothetical protein
MWRGSFGCSNPWERLRIQSFDRTIHRYYWLTALVGLALATAAPAEEPEHPRGPPPGERPVQVRIGFHLFNITDINEKEETVDFDGAILLRWQGPRLAYDPADEGLPEDWRESGISAPPRMYQGDFAVKEVYERWRPRVVISNGIGDRRIMNLSVGVWPDGRVEYIDYFQATIETPMALHDYPFDQQHLDIFINLMTYQNHEVALIHDESLSGTWEQDLGIAEWKKLGIEIRDAIERYTYTDGHADDYSQLLVTLQVARKPRHMFFSIILPLLVLVALTWSVFWMDKESTSDRLGVSFVGILSVVAYYFVVLESVPSIPYLTLMDAFMITTFFVLAGTVVVSFVVDRLNRADEEARGDRLDAICRWAFPLGYATAVMLLIIGYLVF